MFVCRYIFKIFKIIYVHARRIECRILKIYMCVCVWLCEFICIEIHVVLHKCIYMYMYMIICVCFRVYIYVYVYMYMMYIYIYIYEYMYIYI